MAPAANSTTEAAKVFFPTACYGIDVAGTANRMDNVPLRFRAVLANERPADEEIFSWNIEEMSKW